MKNSGSGRTRTRRGAPRGRPWPLKPIEERHRIAAAELASGAAIMPTLIKAGYSENTAKRGIEAVRKAGPITRALHEQLAGQSDTVAFGPEQQRCIIENRLLENIALSRDRALGSLTTLARIRNMLQPEATTVVAVQVNAAPSGRGAEWLDAEPDPE